MEPAIWMPSWGRPWLALMGRLRWGMFRTGEIVNAMKPTPNLSRRQCPIAYSKSACLEAEDVIGAARRVMRG